MTAIPEIDDSLVVRTWFGDEAAWQRTVAAVSTPSPQGYVAYVQYCDDSANDGATMAELHDAMDFGEAAVGFIADEMAQTSEGFPLLVIDVTGDEREPFRCPATLAWDVENDLNLNDTPWESYLDALRDGVWTGVRTR